MTSNTSIIKFIKSIFQNLKDHLGGMVFGFMDGITTGAVVGSKITKRNTFTLNVVRQLLFSISGMLIGSIYGPLLGLLFGKEAVTATLSEYRKMHHNEGNEKHDK